MWYETIGYKEADSDCSDDGVSTKSEDAEYSDSDDRAHKKQEKSSKSVEIKSILDGPNILISIYYIIVSWLVFVV